MNQAYQDELARRRQQGEEYVRQHYTDDKIAQEASKRGLSPEEYREWLVKLKGRLLVISDSKGRSAIGRRRR